MKKTFRAITAVLMTAALVFSFSSCSLIKAFRENTQKVDETVIYDDPADDKVISVFNDALNATLGSCDNIDWSVNFNVSKPTVTNEADNVSVLDSAANQIKNFIMSGKPGSDNGNIKPSDTGSTLIRTLDKTSILDYSFTRNYATENVTDENGDEVTNSKSETVTLTYVCNNLLNLEMRYYQDIPLNPDGTPAETTQKSTETTSAQTEPAEDAEETTAEETTEQETSRTFADSATIEKVFGEPRDKAAVLENFECVKDYMTVKDYTLTYNDCTVSAEVDIENNCVTSLTFVKNMTVTAQVTGVGSLAQYSDMTVTFDVKETTQYTFNNAEETSEIGNESTDAADTTAEITTSSADTTAAEPANDTTVSEETATVITETTVSADNTSGITQ